MSLTVAISTAAAVALIGFPFNNLQTWISWGSWKSVTLLLFYMTMAGILGGVIGWLIGSATKAQLSDVDAVKGLFYGFTGSLVTRADFRFQRNGSAEQRDVASILARFFEWTRKALESVALRAIDRWLSNQSLEALEDLSWQAVEAMRPQLSARQLVTQLELATEALASLHKADRTAQKQFRGSLMNFLRTYYIGQAVPKPPPVRPWPTAIERQPPTERVETGPAPDLAAAREATDREVVDMSHPREPGIADAPDDRRGS